MPKRRPVVSRRLTQEKTFVVLRFKSLIERGPEDALDVPYEGPRFEVHVDGCPIIEWSKETGATKGNWKINALDAQSAMDDQLRQWEEDGRFSWDEIEMQRCARGGSCPSRA